jgi:hypothetical protein
MQLGTFGAIMTFAMELEKRGVSLYAGEAEAISEHARAELLRGSRKRLKRLERAKREGVAEMILEPIQGLEDEEYRVEAGADPAEIAVRFEAVCARYYRDAAEKLPILEISRLFRRMAQENEARKERLESNSKRE